MFTDLKAAFQLRVFHTCVYTHVKVEFALHPTYEITKFIKRQHSAGFVYDLMCIC
jgi:hypothetical protein